MHQSSVVFIPNELIQYNILNNICDESSAFFECVEIDNTDERYKIILALSLNFKLIKQSESNNLSKINTFYLFINFNKLFNEHFLAC